MKSKWNTEFASHPFQQTWASLKDQSSEIALDDETVETDVAEVARLRKVITYLSELIENIDPELTPASTWKNFNAQATPCLAEVTNFNSNRNIAHITNANNHADNLLTYVRPYMVLPKSAAKAVSRSAASYAQAAEDYVENLGKKIKETIAEIDELKAAAESDGAVIEAAQSNIAELESKLFGEDNTSGLKQEIDDLLLDVETKQGSINEAYNEILIGDGEEPSAKQEIAEAKADAIKKHHEIEELLSEASGEISELKSFHSKIFGKLKDDDTREGGLDKSLESLRSNLTAFEKDQSERYQALNQQIESLLPGATSAGLATAYRDMKESFDKPIKHSSSLFYFSVAVLVVASFLLAVESVELTKVTFKTIDSWDAILRTLSSRAPLFAPIVWLAFYATKRRSEAQRLQQEYAHKEALAKSYNSYKKQIVELGEKDDALLKELISKAIDAISHNASATLDGKHGDKMPAQEVVGLGAAKFTGN
jgi:hypothetical protein